MQPGRLLRRVGAASPLVPALTYGVALAAANLLLTLAPTNLAAGLLAVVAWAVAALFLFVVVIWYRDDDWLAAGFLLGLSLVLSGVIADLISRTVVTHSIADAVFMAAGASMGLLVRAIILVPLCGAIVAAMRWATRLFRRRKASVPPVVSE